MIPFSNKNGSLHKAKIGKGQISNYIYYQHMPKQMYLSIDIQKYSQ